MSSQSLEASKQELCGRALSCRPMLLTFHVTALRAKTDEGAQGLGPQQLFWPFCDPLTKGHTDEAYLSFP